MDLDVLETLVARDAETHDAVRMAFFMLGVAHGSITSRGSCRQQNVWCGAAGPIGVGLGTQLNAAVLCWRLNAATPARLPVFNVCLPFFVGWLLKYLISTDSPVESLLVRLEGAEKLVGELEEARHGALMDKALVRAQNTFRFSPLGSDPDSLWDAVVIDCSPPPSLPPGPPSSPSFAPSEPETTPETTPGTSPSSAQNVRDIHSMVPCGQFFAGQTAAGKVLLCEILAAVDGGKRCTCVDFGSDERIVLMEALHASRCDHYFHWDASLAQPRVVGRYGMPVVLKANLLNAVYKGVELVTQVEGSEMRVMGLVAESKKVAVQALAAWIRCSDEEAAQFTAEGVEIHALLQPAVSLQQGARRIWDRHVSRRWEALSDAERTQHHRNMAPFPVPTPAPAPSPPHVAARGAAAPSLDGRWDAHWRARDARDAAAPPERAAPHAPAPTPAPAIVQRVEPLVEVESNQQQHAQNEGAACNVTGRTAQDTSDPAGSDMVRLSDLAELAELQDDEAMVALYS